MRLRGTAYQQLRVLVVIGATSVALGISSHSSSAFDAKRYRVQPKDTLASVAARFDMSVAELQQQIGGALPPVGQEISVKPPGKGEGGAPGDKYIEFYTVKKGDTLLSIANKLQPPMPMEELADFNLVPRRTHLVLAGESLATIAKRYHSHLAPIAKAYNTTPEQLLREWNDLGDKQHPLEPTEGALLVVGWEEPREGEDLAYPSYRRIKEKFNKVALLPALKLGELREVYEVRQGDTLEKIAQKFNVALEDLRRENDMERDTELEVGDLMFIPERKPPPPPTPEPRLASEEQKNYVGIVTQDTHVRERPDEGARGFEVKKGSKLILAGRKGDWFAVLVKRGYGYVLQAHVQVDRPYAPPLTLNEPATTKAREVLAIAYSWLGTPYKFGGNSRRGIDCSAFVKSVFTAAGVGVWRVRAERTASTQIALGKPVYVPPDQLRPGDRLYFDFERSARSGREAPGVADHTGIYIGGGQFIHASGAHGKVVVSQLPNTRYWKNLIGVRRDEI
ncbi:MAG: LysM peptidoglycan-binding domain-containing protein [Abditibacteriales bacterium]|nr:LysM peptidoglycan-binding domain-containing protein [Abditibacteriales bacterium]MDW8365824.1 LysM peptidoglycan-binding domain-containing protein [Abditibacteriales bacterium]